MVAPQRFDVDEIDPPVQRKLVPPHQFIAGRDVARLETKSRAEAAACTNYLAFDADEERFVRLDRD